MGNKRHGAAAVVSAVKGSGGIKATIARRLKVHRHTIDNYLAEYATAQQEFDNEVESIGDMAEVVIIEAIQNKDVNTAKWYAKTKLKSRGYVERSEITGADGKDLVTVNWDDGHIPD